MNFKYLCIDQSGRETKGSLSAADLSEARRKLKDKGLSIVSLDALDKSTAKAGGRGIFSRTRITDSDLYNMAREMSVLLRAGLRVDASLETAATSTSNALLAQSISDVVKSIRGGASVADAFEKTGIFGNLIIVVIRVGESVGDLKMSFEHIARHVQFQMQFKTEIKNALTYPAFLILASVVTLFIIFKFIIPRFFSVFGAGQEKFLPFSAKILFMAGAYMNMYVLGGVALAIVLLLRYLDMKKVAAMAYSYALFVPVVGTIILNLELSRFAYSMYTMLASGIEFLKALRLSTDLIQNPSIKNAVEPAIGLIREGKGVADVFADVSILPDIAISMIRVGEKSGNMKEIFLELFTVFDDRFKTSVKRIVILIEPVIITIMGLIVGFIVISLIMTVMSVGNIKL